MKEREIVARRENGAAKERKLEWKIPRGGDIGEVVRDASGQVIGNYREALDKLKKH